MTSRDAGKGDDERMRFAWERQRLDEEKAERKKQVEWEQRRAEREFKLMEESNQLQREAIAKERSKEESVLVKLKQYGDAILAACQYE